jgi:L-ribulose-5-phosphate 4-epimerase
MTLKRAPAPEMNQVIVLEKWRALLFRFGLVGEYPTENIGYGNLSARLQKNIFLITGSQTGHLAHLQAHHYTKVIDCDVKKGSVTAEGLIPPSSESLSHFALYQANPQIMSVFHVHHRDLWKLLQQTETDSISSEISYGTIEMAEAIRNIASTKSRGAIVMKGHEDGVITFGQSPEEAGKLILDLFRKLSLRQ